QHCRRHADSPQRLPPSEAAQGLVMAKNLDKCRHCRREGEKLFLKGEKCFTDKCPVERRAYAPGQHGQTSGARMSDYGKQLSGQRANIPSYSVRTGDVVQVPPKAKEHLRIKAASEAAEGRGFPEWLQVDSKALKGTFKAMPARSDLSSTINEHLVIELYSK